MKISYNGFDLSLAESGLDVVFAASLFRTAFVLVVLSFLVVSDATIGAAFLASRLARPFNVSFTASKLLAISLLSYTCQNSNLAEEVNIFLTLSKSSAPGSSTIMRPAPS